MNTHLAIPRRLAEEIRSTLESLANSHKSEGSPDAARAQRLALTLESIIHPAPEETL